MNILDKLQALFADSKMRIVIILFVLLLVIGTVSGIIYAIRYMTGPLGAEGVAELKTAPHVQSVVGGWENEVSPAYRKSQEQFNKEQEEKARKEGTSAIPSIIDSKDIPKNIDQSTLSGGVGFSGLKAAGQEGGESKELGLQQAGSLIYDSNGNVLGAVGADGLVRDACGKVIGKVLPDGSVVDLSGKPIGKAGTSAAATGSLIYDDKGNVIGTVGPDGLVRDATGKIIGKVQPDGSIVDLASGKTIGKVGSCGSVSGTLVYDANGKVISSVGTDGLVRDSVGKTLGKALPDGSVVDFANNTIGKASCKGAAAGTLVYDDKGNVIGTVGADGLVRDASGKVIGKAQPDGSIVDPSGKIIGRAGTGAAVGSVNTAVGGTLPGTLVYDAAGNAVGTVGADGLVRDANGKVVGKVLPDGSVVDLSGKPMGKVGTAQSGTLVYGPDGKVLGRIGADGIVRDANGNPLGKVGQDGVLRDANGVEIGRVSPPISAVVGTPVIQPAAAPAAPPVVQPTGAVTLPNAPVGTAQDSATAAADARLKAAMQRQQEALTDQQRAQAVQQMQAAMAAQSSQLFAAWASPTQEYIAGVPDKEDKKSGGDSSSSGGAGNQSGAGAGSGAPPLLVKAGSIQYAVLDTAVNTDEPGPILATIVEGKLKGSRVMGTVTRQDKKAMLTFTVLAGPKLPNKVMINAVAIDPDTARTGIASDVDNHYFLRYGTLFASALLQGYSTVLMTSGSTIIPAGPTTPGQIVPPNLKPRQKLFAALGNVGTRYQAVLGSNFTTPPTVTINSGIGLAILFLDDVAAPASMPPMPLAE